MSSRVFREKKEEKKITNLSSDELARKVVRVKTFNLETELCCLFNNLSLSSVNE